MIIILVLILSCRIFGFVARKPGSGTDNACHLFAEKDAEQPATAIVNFINRVMLDYNKQKPHSK